MKRKADLISTNSVEADEVNCESKKENDDYKLAIELYEPPVAAIPLDHVKKMKRRSRKPREKIDDGPNPSPGIPTRLRNMIEKMGGSECRLIIQKGLRPTDLSKNHSRLSMPSTEWDFLSAVELMMFENGKNVRVPMIDTKMKVWECVSVRRWKMKKTMFVIADVWNKLAAENELKVKDVVQIWCFKFIQTGRHGLAMVKIGAASTHISSTASNARIISSTASNARIITESDAIGSERTRHEGLSTQVAITESALPNTFSDEIDLTLRLNNYSDEIDLTLRL
ncbi:hypothetical protein QQ045_009734 [Rhodiola kirilowii]